MRIFNEPSAVGAALLDSEGVMSAGILKYDK